MSRFCINIVFVVELCFLIWLYKNFMQYSSIPMFIFNWIFLQNTLQLYWLARWPPAVNTTINLTRVTTSVATTGMWNETSVISMQITTQGNYLSHMCCPKEGTLPPASNGMLSKKLPWTTHTGHDVPLITLHTGFSFHQGQTVQKYRKTIGFFFIFIFFYKDDRN